MNVLRMVDICAELREEFYRNLGERVALTDMDGNQTIAKVSDLEGSDKPTRYCVEFEATPDEKRGLSFEQLEKLIYNWPYSNWREESDLTLVEEAKAVSTSGGHEADEA